MRERTSAGETRLFFATDIHGSDSCFKKLLDASTTYDVDTVIIGGDWSGKEIFPIIEREDSWLLVRGDHTETVEDASSLRTIEERIRAAGGYPRRFDPDDFDDVRSSNERREELLETLQVGRLRKWRSWFEQTLGDSSLSIHAICGNDDPEYVADELRTWPELEYVGARVVGLEGGLEIAGYGWTNPTPWETPREKPDEEIRADLEQLAADVGDWSRTILNVHAPPYGTGLDEAYSSGEENPGTEECSTIAVGSEAVRELIETYEPLLSLHGHIHESGGSYRFGRTLSLNPGSEYQKGQLRGAVLTVDDDLDVDYRLTTD